MARDVKSLDGDPMGKAMRRPVLQSRPPPPPEPPAAKRSLLVSAAEDLNGALRRAERALLEYDYATPAHVVMESDAGDLPGAPWQRRLAFGKRDGDWGLFISEGPADLTDQKTLNLWTMSLEVRMRAAASIPALVKALRDSHINQLRALHAATHRLDAFLKDFEVDADLDEVLDRHLRPGGS